MRESDEIIIKNMAESRGLSNASYLGFKNVLRHYTNFQGKSLLELIEEAENEEEEKIRWKNRTIKTRLISYMNYCKDNMTINSAKYRLEPSGLLSPYMLLKHSGLMLSKVGTAISIFIHHPPVSGFSPQVHSN